MSVSFENDPEFKDIIPKPGSGRSPTLGKLPLIVAAIAALLALLMPANRCVWPAASRSQCAHNLRQIALALHRYEQDHHALPPAYTVGPNGRPLHSWRTLILPYLEQESLYETIDLSKPWDDPVNAAASAARPSVFNCPEDVGPKNTTTYLAIVGPDGFLAPERSRQFEEITDGLSSTLAVIEASEEDAVPWMAPIDANANTVMKLDAKAKLHHAGGTNAALADGGVMFLNAGTTAPMRQALLSISGDDNDAIEEK
jgi:hypothetical protein